MCCVCAVRRVRRSARARVRLAAVWAQLGAAGDYAVTLDASGVLAVRPTEAAMLGAFCGELWAGWGQPGQHTQAAGGCGSMGIRRHDDSASMAVSEGQPHSCGQGFSGGWHEPIGFYVGPQYRGWGLRSSGASFVRRLWRGCLCCKSSRLGWRASGGDHMWAAVAGWADAVAQARCRTPHPRRVARWWAIVQLRC